jgi:hypothetical protein
MKKLLLAAAVLGCLAQAGAAGGIDFDRGAGLGEAIAQAGLQQVNTEVSYYRNACQTITLGAGENFAALDLVSGLYADRTEVISWDQGGPVVTVTPYETGRFTTKTTLARAANGMYPWEKETFLVCALGSEVTFKVTAAANKYKSVAEITPLDAVSQSAAYALRAVAKLPMSPDPAGIKVADFRAGPGGTVAVSASDKWAAYYAGETVRFTARVLETVYPDAQSPDQSAVWHREVARAQVELPAAAAYAPVFQLGQLPAGYGYTVSVSFARLGAVSTPEEVEAAVFPL